MSRCNKTDSDLLTGLLQEAITKRLSGVGRTVYLLSADYLGEFYIGLQMGREEREGLTPNLGKIPYQPLSWVYTLIVWLYT